VESEFKALQVGCDDRRKLRNCRAALAAVALLLAFALVSGCHRDPNVRKQKYLESGQKYSAEGKDKEAAIQYSNALKIDKNFVEAHYALAQAFLHMGALPPAFTELRRTVELQPTNYKARVDLGNILLAGGKIDEAKAQADTTLAAQPNNADAHALLARVAARQGNRDLALVEIKRALELAPSEAALHETYALLEAGDATQQESVEEELKKSVVLDPRSVNAKLLLAAFYARSKRFQDAEQMCWNAVTADTKSLSARQSLAQIILKEGDQPRAEQVLRQASNDLADNPRGVRLLADFYIRSGQTDKAKAEFASLAQKYPKNLDLQEGYVRILLQVKDFATAQTVVTGMMKKNSKDPQVAGLNGIVLLNNGRPGDAVQALQEAATNTPKDAFIQYWLGKAALAKGDSGLAEKSFRQAAQLQPPGLEAQEELARMAAQRGDMGLLGEVADKTISTAPRFLGGYLWRATVEVSHNEADKAEADLKTATSIAPQNPRAYLMLGELRLAQKRFPEATAMLEQALQYDPNSVGALRGLVAYDLFQKKPDQAVARVNAQIAKSPNNSGFYDLLAQLQIQSKKIDDAVASAQKAMQLNPEDGEAVTLYARLEVQRGKAADAITVWEQWAKTHPSNAGVLVILGMLEESHGDKVKAEDYYKKALQIQPEQPVAANNLAYLMLENGENADVALSWAQTARRGMPNSPNSADTLAWAYYSKGTYGFARDLLEDAVKTDPNNASFQYHLGMVCGKMHDKTDAELHLKKAVSLAPGTQTEKDAQAALQGLG
jgi:Tfp pilus assembly protein PilF